MNARYEPGSSIPTGKAELKLNVGKLEFRSTSLDWLVATETSAQFQGRGTVNGSGDYAFSIIVIDGQSTGAVRIRIWHRVSGTILYDSRPGAPLDETRRHDTRWREHPAARSLSESVAVVVSEVATHTSLTAALACRVRLIGL